MKKSYILWTAQIRMISLINLAIKYNIPSSELFDALYKTLSLPYKWKPGALEDIKYLIPCRGIGTSIKKCSKCNDSKPESEFKYYKTRVNKDGTPMRVNALCNSCSLITNGERAKTFEISKLNGSMPERPGPDVPCPMCKRMVGPGHHSEKWHLDHDEIKHIVRGWLCGHCNMSKSDHFRGVS